MTNSSEDPTRQDSVESPPEFTELNRDEIDALLHRNVVGRIAYSHHDRVDIEPIHYVYSNGWIYGRTSRGTKLATIAHHRWVAFEVDEFEDIFHWESVVIHGAFYLIEPQFGGKENHEYVVARDLLKKIVPKTLSAGDPVSFRNVVFRIHVDAVRGRRARPS